MMKVWSVIGTVHSGGARVDPCFAADDAAGGIELRVDEAQAITYRRARVTARRVGRRTYRRVRRVY